MNRRSSNIIVKLLIVLGIFGLVYTLFTQPSRLFVQLGTIALVVGIIFLVYKFYMRHRMGGKEQSAYIRAVKQSKRRFNESIRQKPTISKIDTKKSAASPKRTFGSSVPKKKKSTHLTVIEGKKGKKKNRALF